MLDEPDRTASPHIGETRKRLLYAHLITLLALADESAAIAYPRRLHMPDIHRQLILMLGIYGSATSKDLVLQSGREKAQVSRGLKALSEAGLVHRPTTRGAILLSPCGEALFAEIVAIAKERNAALCAGIPATDIKRFLAITAALIDKASSIFLADEKQLPIDLAARSLIHHPPETSASVLKSAPEEPTFRDMVLPWIMGLVTYLRRSGENLFLREVGMSAFEWRVLSQIEENKPVNLARLIALLSRDKSQVARMIKKLTMAGLVDRTDERRINVTLALTAAGRASYERICAISEQRDSFMFAGYSRRDRDFYVAMMLRLTANARSILASESAARPIDPARPAPIVDVGTTPLSVG